MDRFIAAHDVGKVLNPKLLEGQLEGSIHMGLGFALTESLEVEGGRITNGTLRKLGVLRAAYTLATGWDMATPMPAALDVSKILLLSLAPDGAATVEALNVDFRSL